MDFLSKDDEKEIIAAIAAAEKQTSGEIKIHIETKSKKPPFERAQEVFLSLGMQHTQARNGVLFYVGVHDKSFVILGDHGINELVGNSFWESTKDIVVSHFKNKEFKIGLIQGILEAGERLKKHFPYQKDDVNELSNDISKN